MTYAARFIFTPGELMVVIASWRWWILNEAEVTAWAKPKMNIDIKGMVLTFDNEEELMLFKLRWE